MMPMKKSLLSIAYVVVFALIMGGTVHAQARSFSTDYIGHNVYWNGTNWVSTGAGYGSVVGPSTGTGDINFYTTGNAASGGLTRTLTQAAAITPAGTVSATAMQAYTGSFGNVNATGTISATNMNVGALNVTNLTVNGGAYSGGAGGISATMVAGWPDAIECTASGASSILYAFIMPHSDGKYWYGDVNNFSFLKFNSDKSYYTQTNLTGYDCINKTISQLYASGQAFNLLGNGGANGENGYDNIISGTTKITANGNGYISLTTGGVTTGYFDTAGKLVVPTISTTGAISATRAYFTETLGVGRAIESWMPSNTIVTKGQVIADTGVNTGAGYGYSWEDGHVSVASNDGTDVEMRTDYVARLKIISNGNVGINTTDPNATLDVHGTISATALTVNGVAVTGGGGIGIGQTWQNVKASRTSFTIYQNTTGKPIMVQISAEPSIVVDVGTTSDSLMSIIFGSSVSQASFIVPDGYYYRAYQYKAASGGNSSALTIYAWSELR
jgi:hypothetical protein